MKLANLFCDLRQGHSDLQMDQFITAKSGCGNTYGMYQQALRELHARTTALADSYYKRQITALDCEELAEKACRRRWTKRGKIEARRQALQLQQLRVAQDMLEVSIREQEREFLRFYQQAFSLRSKLGTLLPEDVARLDEQYWVDRIKVRMAVEGTPTQATMDLVVWMPQHTRPVLLDFLGKSPEERGAWLLARRSPEVLADVKMPELDVEREVEDAMQTLKYLANAPHP